MKPKPKLLAIVGSQRKGGNSYALAKTVLESADADSEIVELADVRVDFCDICEKCADGDCALQDGFNGILEKMRRADGIVFSVPKYLFVGSKFLCFLERLATINHMREHGGYERSFRNPEYRLFEAEKPFCLFVGSGTGKVERQTVKTVAEYIESTGLMLIRHDKPPFFGVNVKAGDRRGAVLDNERDLAECRRLVRKVVNSIKN
jgi:multimeric flavodoxin WrbA